MLVISRNFKKNLNHFAHMKLETLICKTIKMLNIFDFLAVLKHL